MGMIQAREGACLGEELLYLFASQLRMQDFDGSQGRERGMSSQVNISEVPSCYQLDEAIAAKLLSQAVSIIRHLVPSPSKSIDVEGWLYLSKDDEYDPPFIHHSILEKDLTKGNFAYLPNRL